MMTVPLSTDALSDAVRTLATTQAAARRAAALHRQLDEEHRRTARAVDRLDALTCSATPECSSLPEEVALGPAVSNDVAVAAAGADLGTHARAAKALSARLGTLEAQAEQHPASGDPAVLLATQVTLVEAAQQAAADAARELSGVSATLVSTTTGATTGALFGHVMLSMVEHGLVDAATQQLARAQTAMDVLAAELDDVSAAGDGAEKLDDHLRLFDLWFADFFTDFALQQRLAEAHDIVYACQEDLHVVAGRLDARHAQLALRLRH
jgi:hypothetical protein